MCIFYILWRSKWKYSLLTLSFSESLSWNTVIFQEFSCGFTKLIEVFYKITTTKTILSRKQLENSNTVHCKTNTFIIELVTPKWITFFQLNLKTFLLKPGFFSGVTSNLSWLNGFCCVEWRKITKIQSLQKSMISRKCYCFKWMQHICGHRTITKSLVSHIALLWPWSDLLQSLSQFGGVQD